MKKRVYKYFISYRESDAVGRIGFDSIHKIESMEDINRVEKGLRKELKKDTLIITNYILFDKE